MKRKAYEWVTLGAVLGCVLAGMLVTGCSHLKQIPPAEFKRQADPRMNMNSFYWCEYIGQADGKAYLLRKRMPLIGSQCREDILFTPIAELGPEFMPKLDEMKKEWEAMKKKWAEEKKTKAAAPRQP